MINEGGIKNETKRIKKTKKVNQTEIAKYLNTTQVTYGRYELETCEPTIETLTKLADYYNVSLDYLVGRDFSNDIGYLTQQEKEFFKTYKQLNIQNQNKAIGYVQGLFNGQEEK